MSRLLTIQAAEGRHLRQWRTALRMLAIGLGAAYAAAAAFGESMNEDGMSYLDQGDAWMRGDWNTAINAVWSPLYAWIQGAALVVARPSIRMEFPTVHLVNFMLYLGALACFEFFWRRVTEVYVEGEPEGNDPPAVVFPERTWLCFGYALFIWSSLTLIEIWSVTPDMLVAAVVYLASGLLVRIREGRATIRTFLGLGVVLGVGYLAKAALFPMAFVFLVLGVLVQGNLRQGLARMLPAAVISIVIGGPFLAALSIKERQFTFSDVGELTYLKHVHGIPFPHWVPGVVEGIGEPEHPVRRIFEQPTVYEFAEPVGGTYPLSYDPYYWYKGLVPELQVRPQLVALAKSAEFYFDLFIRRQGGLVAVTLVLCFLAAGSARGRRMLPGRWELLVVSFAALGMYSLVHVTWRYVAAFVVLLWAGLLTTVRLPDSPANRRLLSITGAALTLFIGLDFGAQSWLNARSLIGVAPSVEVLSTHLRTSVDPAGGVTVDVAPWGATIATAPPSQIAEALLAQGLQRGDRVGVVGRSFGAFWARLARLKIVAEIVPAEADLFWGAGAARQAEVVRAFQMAGAVAIVTDRFPPDAAIAGWEPVGQTGYRVYRIASEAEDPARARQADPPRPLADDETESPQPERDDAAGGGAP